MKINLQEGMGLILSDNQVTKLLGQLYETKKEFKKYDYVIVIKDRCNASDFHTNGKGVYNFANWEELTFQIAHDYIPITFEHSPDIYGAYPLKLPHKAGIIGFVYNIALKKI